MYLLNKCSTVANQQHTHWLCVCVRIWVTAQIPIDHNWKLTRKSYSKVFSSHGCIFTSITVKCLCLLISYATTLLLSMLACMPTNTCINMYWCNMTPLFSHAPSAAADNTTQIDFLILKCVHNACISFLHLSSLSHFDIFCSMLDVAQDSYLYFGSFVFLLLFLIGLLTIITSSNYS